MWENQHGKRSAKPNRLSNNPTLSFRSTLNPETLTYLRKMKKLRKGSEFICQAIESY